MQRVREGRWRRLRRPAAAAAVLAVLGTLVPVTTATAAAVGLGPREPERAGAVVTYDFDCDNHGSPLAPIRRIWNPSGQQDVAGIAQYTVSGSTTSGTFTYDLTNAAYGRYSMVVQCTGVTGDEGQPSHAFTLEDPRVTTSTSLAASPASVVVGDAVTLTATVSGVTEGAVTFSTGEHEIETVALTDGTARLVVHPETTQTYTAQYAGTETSKASSSATTVTVVTAITPGTPELATTPAVGVPLSVTTGSWSPADTALSYQWVVGGEPAGTGPTYTPAATDLGKTIQVAVTGTRAPLPAVTRWTPEGITVAPGTIPAGGFVLDGAAGDQAVLGRTLTPQPSGFGTDASYAYEWFVGDDEFSTRADTYTPTAADLGRMIRMRATITAPGRTTISRSVYLMPATAEPTVTVGSRTVTVGTDAVVPVTVSGPAGGPTPTGSVEVTLTPVGSATGTSLGTLALDGRGSASVTAPGTAVGAYTVGVRYVPASGSHAAYSMRATPITGGPYTAATGSGTVTVTKVTPTVTLPATLTVAVATPADVRATVAGSRLPAQYALSEGGTVLARGEVPGTGVLDLRVPALTPGTHTLTFELPATATTAAVTRTLTVTVTGEPARDGLVPTADLASPEKATAPGQEMVLVAEGFEPGETVAFYLHSEPVFLGTAVAGADGSARLTVTIPADVPAGAHTVYATGGTSGRWATLAVELAVPAAAPAATPADELATTGASGGLAAAAAWALLFVGGGLVVLARRARIAR
jgi:hypothetical protein